MTTIGTPTRYPGRCRCGADVPAGNHVLFGDEWDWQRGPHVVIRQCPRCCDLLDRGRVDVRDSDLRSECRGGNLAARIRRQREKRRKRG